MGQHNWLIHRINRREVQRIAELCRGDLLDIGCGQKPYENLLNPYVTRYVGLEHPDTKHPADRVDVWGSATELPFSDQSFDTVVAFQVLEHVEEPHAMLAEAYRVLRPSGLLILTTPFMWGVHEAPRDFYRFTEFGLRHLFERAHFTSIETTAVSGYWVTACLRLSYYLHRFGRGPFKVPLAVVQGVIQLTGMALDRLDRVEGDAAGYVTIGRRRAS